MRNRGTERGTPNYLVHFRAIRARPVARSGFWLPVYLPRYREAQIREPFEHKARKKTVLTAEELAALWHVPAGGVGDLLTARGAYLPPPPEVIVTTKPPFSYDWRIMGRGYMNTGDSVFVRWTYGGPDRFDTLVHGFFTGATGSGKSALMGNQIAQDILWGGCATLVIEPLCRFTPTGVGTA